MRIWLALALMVVATAAWSQAAAPEKKLIAVGWDMPNAERLRANLSVMETTPLQGCSVRFAGPRNNPELWFSFTSKPYDAPVVDQFLTDLKAVQPRQLHDRFLLLNANPGDVDWFDDAGWAVIAEHWRTAARVAKAGGLAGIMFDPEAYREPYRAFDWSKQPQTGRHTFAQYTAQARRRGREIMAAVADEYPDAKLFTLFLFSGVPSAARATDPDSVLVGSPYGLLPAFANGWLDAIPPTLTLIDGCEEAYRYNSRLDYLSGANLVRGKCQRLVAPGNRAKYRAQVQVSFGVYLDAYANPPDTPWYINPGKQTPVQRLAENVATALDIADEYVWVYGEQCSWWPTPMPDANKVRWPEKLPGLDRALRLAVDPIAYVLECLNQPGERTNLVVNGDFGGANAAPAGGQQPADWQQGAAPPAWSYWQTKTSKGHPGWDRQVGHNAPGSGTLVGMQSGCLIHDVTVTPGDRYALIAWCRTQGAGAPSAVMRWQTADGKWHAEPFDQPLSPVKTEGGWTMLAATSVVPEGAGKLVALLSASGQQSDHDIIWWDDVWVFKVD